MLSGTQFELQLRYWIEKSVLVDLGVEQVAPSHPASRRRMLFRGFMMAASLIDRKRSRNVVLPVIAPPHQQGSGILHFL
jgi:hypothetical protein